MPEIPGKCINDPVAKTVMEAVNITTELVIIVLPIPLLWQLKMSKDKKYMLSAVFLIGGWCGSLPPLNPKLRLTSAIQCMRCQHCLHFVYQRPQIARPDL